MLTHDICRAGGFKPQFVPQLSGIVTLFSRSATAASLWLHLVAGNLFAARSLFIEGAPALKSLPTCAHAVRHQPAACLSKQVLTMSQVRGGLQGHAHPAAQLHLP